MVNQVIWAVQIDYNALLIVVKIVVEDLVLNRAKDAQPVPFIAISLIVLQQIVV